MIILSFGHIPSWAGGKQETGAANVIYHLALNMSRINHDLVILAATDFYEKEKCIENLLLVGWTKNELLSYVVLHPFQSFQNLLNLIRLKRRYNVKQSFISLFLKRTFLIRTIIKYHVEIVQLHMDEMFYVDIIPNFCKIVSTCHGLVGLDRNINNFSVYSKMEKDTFLSNKIDLHIFVSKQILKDIVKLYGNNNRKNFVIYNSYDNKIFKYIEKDKESKNELTLCTVASISERKGQLRVLEALKNSFQKKIYYFCIGIGDEKYINSLINYAKINNINFEYVEIKKPLEIRQLLSKADYMIMPSSSEGFGLTYLESIACGTPVILPKNLPIAEERSLINNENSIFLDDYSSQSICKILKVLNSYKFNRKNVSNSIQSHSWENQARTYIKTFEQL